MPYSRTWPLAAYLQRRRLDPVDQVANRPDKFADLTPVSEAPAEAVRAAWKPVERGQTIPMVGEQVYAEPDDDR
jgi:hypothetical protein